MSIANELITRGWTQGNYEGPDGSVCLAGACGACDFTISHDLFFRCIEVVTGVLEDLYGTDSIGGWNDAPDRTFDEVLRVAKLADEILDAQ